MHKILIPVARIFALLAMALWPLSVIAAPPSSVQEVNAAYESRAVKITWKAPVGRGIARYRIYYSHASILQNNGKYDDFFTTEDAATEYILRGFTTPGRVFFAVLAVNDTGEESATFGGEGMAEIPVDAASQGGTQAQGASAAVTASAPRLLSVQSLSQTGVLLTFSQFVTVPQEDAATAFRITNGSGVALAIRQIVLRGPTITLVTEPQKPGRYAITVTQVWGTDAAGVPAQVDPASRVAVFSFPPAGDVLSSSVLQTQGTAPAPTNVQLRIIARTGNFHDVLATFDVAATSDLSSLEVFPSTDDGKTFGAPQTLPSTARSVQFAQVPAGVFAILIRSHTQSGLASASVPASISIATASGTSRSPLSGSGPGIVAVITLTGAVMGWRKMKRR